MTHLDWEKVRRKRTRSADHPAPTTKAQWYKLTTRYEARCKQCGGPICPGETCWTRQRDRREYLHIGHSPTRV